MKICWFDNDGLERTVRPGFSKRPAISGSPATSRWVRVTNPTRVLDEPIAMQRPRWRTSFRNLFWWLKLYSPFPVCSTNSNESSSWPVCCFHGVIEDLGWLWLRIRFVKRRRSNALQTVCYLSRIDLVSLSYLNIVKSYFKLGLHLA